jgi:intracellular sulfur oxidation DsrE/DsrF family protein
MKKASPPKVMKEPAVRVHKLGSRNPELKYIGGSNFDAWREKVKIEVVTFGPGLHMLRDDTSPVKARIEQMALNTPEVSFKACGNTQEKMQQAEHKDIPIVSQAQVVKSGVVRVMELQEKGWTYVKP